MGIHTRVSSQKESPMEKELIDGKAGRYTKDSSSRVCDKTWEYCRIILETFTKGTSKSNFPTGFVKLLSLLRTVTKELYKMGISMGEAL
jgi:hypothetical protein